jgi:hypothetical protein
MIASYKVKRHSPLAIVGDRQIIEAEAVVSWRTVTTIAAWCTWDARKSIATGARLLPQAFDLEFQSGHQAAKISDPLAIVDDHLIIEAETVTAITAWCAGNAWKSIATWARFFPETVGLKLQFGHQAAKLSNPFVNALVDHGRRASGNRGDQLMMTGTALQGRDPAVHGFLQRAGPKCQRLEDMFAYLQANLAPDFR